MVEAKVSLLSLLEREYLGRPGQGQVNSSDMEAAPKVESLVPISHKNLAMEVRPLVLALLLPLGFKGDWTRWSLYIFKCVFYSLTSDLQGLFLARCCPWTYFIWGREWWWTWWRRRWWLVFVWGCETLEGKTHDEEAIPYSLFSSSHLVEEPT